MSNRSLTAGEIALAQRLFKDAIDYDKVRIHNRRYVFGQPYNSAVAPNGNIYAVGAVYCDDYSSAHARLRVLLIHEMVHVWQYQLKVLRPVFAAIAEFIRHGFNYAKAYDYDLRPGHDLLQYRIEQQAQIVEDYYLLHIETIAPADNRVKGGSVAAANGPLYLQVLENFLLDPSYARKRTI